MRVEFKKEIQEDQIYSAERFEGIYGNNPPKKTKSKIIKFLLN
jgi:hypothetical protein